MTRAGVSDALVDQLDAVADSTGYGVAVDRERDLESRQGFALTMVGSCREVAAGHRSWADLVRQDVADGAVRSDAERLYEFVRTRMCPVIKPEAAASAPLASSAAGSAATRGLLSDRAWWDARFRPGSAAMCTRYAGTGLGPWLAYTLAPGRTACWDAAPRWDDLPIGVTVVFDPPVVEDEALLVAERLLPADHKEGTARRGSNAPHASAPGSCASRSYTSDALREAVTSVRSEWSEPESARIMLYSGRMTDEGADGPFVPRSVRLADLSIGSHNESSDGEVTC